MHRTVKHGPPRPPTVDCWHRLVSGWISLRFLSLAPAPRSDVILSGDDDNQPVTCRCQMQDVVSGCELAVTQITHDDESHVALPSFTPPGKNLFAPGSGFPRALWNQRDDLEFWPLTPAWKVLLCWSCARTIGSFFRRCWVSVPGQALHLAYTSVSRRNPPSGTPGVNNAECHMLRSRHVKVPKLDLPSQQWPWMLGMWGTVATRQTERISFRNRAEGCYIYAYKKKKKACCTCKRAQKIKLLHCSPPYYSYTSAKTHIHELPTYIHFLSPFRIWNMSIFGQHFKMGQLQMRRS